MKKNLFLFIFLFSSLLTSAQKYTYEDVSSEPASKNKRSPSQDKLDVNKLRFGAFIAPSLTWMHPVASASDDGRYHVSSKGSRAGYQWGLVAEYYFADNYGFVSGFNIELAGGKLMSTANTNHVDTTLPNTVISANMNYKLQYIDIPFALKLRSDELPKTGMRIFGQIGLTVAFNISRKANYDVVYNAADTIRVTASGSNEILKGTLATPPIMLQLNVGAGIEYPITEKLFFFTGLYFNNGFLPTAINPQNFELGYKGSFTNPNTRLNSFALRVGLFF
jgi:hypothetical protein